MLSKKLLLILLLFLCGGVSLRAITIQGVTPAPQVQVSGQELTLNGAGLRTFSLLGIPIKIYVAAFYAPAPLSSAEAVMASPGPLQFDFTFLRAVSQSDVTKAWTAQFADSVSFTYPGYEKDRDAFIALFGPLQSGGVESVRFSGNETLVYDSGTLKGTIPGHNFQKAFLSLWFGSKAVSPDLKASLLGKP